MKTIAADHVNRIELNNESAVITAELFGGAITGFHLQKGAVNPLSFAFTNEQMPENNKGGAPFRGHFLCMGRWGQPSDEERKAGMPDHGQIANIMWQADPLADKHALQMRVESPLEALSVERMMRIDEKYAVFGVRETVVNTCPLGRLYNMVQHPTLASPFLDNTTAVNCNATVGFEQFRYDHPEKDPLNWPIGRDGNCEPLDLRTPDSAYNSVFSFVVDNAAEYGWVTAFSQQHQLLLGYIWKRNDYPWIHLWQHWEGEKIQYRGMEFGTAGIHQPFKTIIETGVKLFGEKTVGYIEPGETVSRRYLSFLHKTNKNIRDITLENGGESIIIHFDQERERINTSFKDFL